LSTDAYAFFIHIATSVGGTSFEDNFFELPPGTCRTIGLRNLALRRTPDMVTVRSR
jgi:hypothetical protein